MKMFLVWCGVVWCDLTSGLLYFRAIYLCYLYMCFRTRRSTSVFLKKNFNCNVKATAVKSHRCLRFFMAVINAPPPQKYLLISIMLHVH